MPVTEKKYPQPVDTYIDIITPDGVIENNKKKVFRDCIKPSAAACRRIWREPRNEEIALQFLNAPLPGSCAGYG